MPAKRRKPVIEQVFTSLTLALEKSAMISVGTSLLWGILSILLSPCHLASIPLIIGFVSSQEEKLTVKKAFFISLLFSTGILITIALIGAITGLAGRMLGDVGIWGTLGVSIVFFAIGLYLLGVIDLPFISGGVNQPEYTKKGYLAALLLGLIFGVALGPCTFAFMMPVLAAAFKQASSNWAFSFVLVTAYAAGHCAVIVIAGTFTEAVEKYLSWGEKSKAVIVIKKICGLLVIAAGIYMISGILKF